MKWCSFVHRNCIWLSKLALWALALVCLPNAFGQSTFTVTSTKSAITVPDDGAFSIIIRENSATPSAAYTVYEGASPLGTATGAVMAAGQSYYFSAPSGFPFRANQVIGFIASSGAGPYTFV